MSIKDYAETIQSMREHNKSYGEIANSIGYAKDTVKKYCQVNGLGGLRAKDNSLAIREKEYIKKFNIKYPTFSYVSGYKRYDSTIKIECKICSHIQERNAHSKENILCDNCMEIERKEKEEDKLNQKEQAERIKLINKLIRIFNSRIYNIQREELSYKVCKRCGIEYKADSIKSVHCEKCIEDIKIEQSEQIGQWKGKRIECRECGNKFEMQYLLNYYCSEACKRKTANRVKEINRRTKLKKNGRIDYSISLTKLIRKDKNICHICGEKCDSEDYIRTDEGYFIAGERYPSIDHIHPVAKGGTHTWNNVKLAHRGCNAIKNDKIIYEENNGQLRLY